MKEYEVHIKKENRSEVVEEHPNLTAPIYLKAAVFSTEVDLESYSDQKIKSIAEQQLEEQFRPSQKPGYSFQEKEEIRVVENRSKTIYEGEVSLPQFSNGKGGNGSVQLD